MGFGGWGGPGHYVVTPLQLELRLSWAVAICSEFKGWILCIHMTKYSYRDISKRQNVTIGIVFLHICLFLVFLWDRNISHVHAICQYLCNIQGSGWGFKFGYLTQSWNLYPTLLVVWRSVLSKWSYKGGGGGRFVFGGTQWLYEIEKISWNPMTIFEKFQISGHRKDPRPFFGPRQQLKLL